ncbi:hypothetical protein LBMAG47_24770 [Planctomycetia bacterium]|nr:hypothetical protein LBMAG47_24770 [Planctomycetia bacterium]
MGRMSPAIRLLPILMRSHARNPEPWTGALVAVAAVWSLAGSPGDPIANAGPRVAVAVLMGAFAQAAAGAVVTPPLSAIATVPMLLARICWPAGGACLAAVVGRLVWGTGDWGTGDWGEVATGVAAAAAATATMATACVRRGIAAADALSAALAAAACGAAAACASSGVVPPLAAAVVGWTVAACAIRSLPASSAPGAGWHGRRAERPTPAATLLGHGPVRSALSTAAMATALAGMVAWFFLDPARAAWYPLLAVTWFVCLAVPQAVALPVAGRAGDLGRSAAGADGVWRLPAVRRARASVTAHALVLGWPALVALGLHGSGALARGDQVVGPPATLVGLAGAAGAVTGIVCLAARCGLPACRVRAVAFTVAAASGLAAFAILPALPDLLRPPAPSGPGGHVAGRAAVETAPANRPEIVRFFGDRVDAMKPRLRKWPVWNDN